MIGAKPLHIRCDKIDGFIRFYDGTRYLVLFEPEKCGFIYRVRYLMGVKSGIIYVICHNYAKIKVESYHTSPLEKALTLHNVIILIQSALAQIKIFTTIIYLGKGSYHLRRNNNNR